MEISPKDQEIINRWILILLGTAEGEPIRGRLRFTKEFFLISKTIAPEIEPELERAVNFYPYQIGPYSSRLAFQMNNLIQSNQVDLRFKSQDWAYFLSKESLIKAKQLIEALPESVKKQVAAIKQRLKRMSTRRILQEIYTDYPKYAQTSAVVDEVICSVDVDLTKRDEADDGPGFIACSTNHDLELTEDETTILAESLAKFSTINDLELTEDETTIIKESVAKSKN